MTCSHQSDDDSCIWSVESVESPNDYDGLFVKTDQFQSSFLSKFVESHRVIFELNSQLQYDDDGISSKPWNWLYYSKVEDVFSASVFIALNLNVCTLCSVVTCI